MILVDTNVLSETRKSAPHPGVVAWLENQPRASLLLSVLTIGEVLRGIEQMRARNAIQAERLGLWFAEIRTRFNTEPVPVSLAVAERWGRLSGVLASRGITLPDIDGLLAATAMENGWALATRNTRDVAATGVPAINPWDTIKT